MKHTTLPLISTNPELERACVASLEKYPEIHIETLASISAFRTWVPGKSIGGILIDLRTLIGSPPAERTYINDLLESLPVAKIRLDPKSGLVTANIDSEALVGDEFFAHLVKKLGSHSAPRAIRRFPRRSKILNVELRHGDAEPLRTNTVNVSEGGMFVICSHQYPRGTMMKVRIVELDTDQLIDANVCWGVEWGKSTNHYAGIGVEFLSLNDEQCARLHELLGVNKPSGPLTDELLAQLVDEL